MKKKVSQLAVLHNPQLIDNPVYKAKRLTEMELNGKAIHRMGYTFPDLSNAVSWLLQQTNWERCSNLILRVSSSGSGDVMVNFDFTP